MRKRLPQRMDKIKGHSFVTTEEVEGKNFIIQKCELCGIVRKKYPQVSAFQEPNGTFKVMGVPECTAVVEVVRQHSDEDFVESSTRFVTTPKTDNQITSKMSEEPYEFQRPREYTNIRRGPELVRADYEDLAEQIFVKAVMATIRGPLPFSLSTVEEIADDAIRAARIFKGKIKGKEYD